MKKIIKKKRKKYDIHFYLREDYTNRVNYSRILVYYH